MDLDLMAPIQLENLLPYNLQYRIYDKDTDQNWRSYLRAGGIMPIHSVELTHLVLLNVEINDTGWCPGQETLASSLHFLQLSKPANSASLIRTGTQTSTLRIA
jgi:vacuolar protein sorting-associated protein 13A/C